MKTIIISDLHNRIDFVELALSSPILEPYDRVLFLGDYFDDFNDTIQDTRNVAKWLRKSLYEPNRIHLMGTHDMWYRFPSNHFLKASGNTINKAYAIDHILTDEDWNILKLFHYEQNFLMTHAGVHQYLINQYISENKDVLSKYTYNIENRQMLSLNTQEIIDKIIKPATDEAFICANRNMQNSWLDAGLSRGGAQPVGGITWLDWRYEFDPIPDLNQIVGHTESHIPQSKNTDSSENYCLDTRNAHIGILEDGIFKYVETIKVLEAIDDSQ